MVEAIILHGGTVEGRISLKGVNLFASISHLRNWINVLNKQTKEQHRPFKTQKKLKIPIDCSEHGFSQDKAGKRVDHV